MREVSCTLRCFRQRLTVVQRTKKNSSKSSVRRGLHALRWNKPLAVARVGEDAEEDGVEGAAGAAGAGAVADGTETAGAVEDVDAEDVGAAVSTLR